MASNDFLIFDENEGNILTQADYVTDTDRTGGFRTGIARSNVTNKVLYQVSKLCHAFGDILKDNDYNASDSMSVAELKTAIINTFSSESVLERCYPVGSIFCSVNSTSPATLFGFGTWEQIKDRFLLACGDTYSNNTTGGVSSVSLSVANIPSHSHTATISASGSHTHGVGTLRVRGTLSSEDTQEALVYADNLESTGCLSVGSQKTNFPAFVRSGTGYVHQKIAIDAQKNQGFSGYTDSTTHSHSVSVTNTGSGTSHNNMPPYLTVYVWKRTA